MMMISVHSNGQPSTKMIACDKSMNEIGDILSESTQPSSSACPPRIANTPENSAEPTNSQHTMAVVLAVRNTSCLVPSQSSGRASTASPNAPNRPTTAHSSSPQLPNKIPP